jgi:hypothetical protein
MSKDNIEILYEVYAASGLGKWFAQDWKDISRKKKGGGHPSCGASAGKGVRKKSKSKKYPKCVPASRAAGMSKKEKSSAVRRKRAAGNKGKKPNWVSTKPKKEVFIATENNMRVNELLKFLNEEAKPSKKMVKENNIVETIRALVLEELTKEVATPDAATGTTPTGSPATAPAAGAAQAAPAGQAASTPGATPPPAPAAGQTGATPAPNAGTTPPAAPPVTEMRSLEEDLDEAFGLEENRDTQSTTAGVVSAPASDCPPCDEEGKRMGLEESGDPASGPSGVVPVAELEECGSNYENELEENLFAESKVVRGRVLSESAKNGELLMQERRRKQLIQVQNKILYSKR